MEKSSTMVLLEKMDKTEELIKNLIILLEELKNKVK